MSSSNKIKETGRNVSEKHDAPYTDRQAYDLAGTIAHDLNTILTTIYGYSELALDSLESDSEAGRNVRRIIEAADRARKLTGQLLDSGRSPAPEKVTVKVSDVLSETLDFILPTVRNNITVTRQFKDPDLLVETVPEQLFRVFMNIAVNALQSMEENGGSLTVTLDSAIREEGPESGPDSSLAHVRFADTGKGMDAETASKVLDPFFTSGKKNEGTGLGLTIVKDLVNEMEGTLKIESERGKGTVIDLLFPVARFGPLPEKLYLGIPKK